jgi:hypothetical protein
MVNQDLLTTFIAITTLAILIQTGIVAGLFFVTRKISQQADRAIGQTHKLFEPVHRLVGTLETTSERMTQYSASAPATIREFESKAERTLERVRQKIA